MSSIDGDPLPQTHWMNETDNLTASNLATQTVENYAHFRFSDAPLIPTSASTTSTIDAPEQLSPIPSSTPPHPSWWIRANGEGYTRLGHLWRLAVSAKRWGTDKVIGPVPGITIPELAHRLDRMTSEQLYRLLCQFQETNPHFYFSAYLCLNSIQSMNENDLKAHLDDFFTNITMSDDDVYVFPIYIKNAGTFDSEHMTVFLANRGKVEFYDSMGISSVNYRWTTKSSVRKVATIIHKALYPTQTAGHPLENHNPHQSCIAMCGLFVAAWIHHRVILGKSQKEWIAKLEDTSDEQVRLEVTQILNICPKTASQTEPEDEKEKLLFEFDDV